MHLSFTIKFNIEAYFYIAFYLAICSNQFIQPKCFMCTLWIKASAQKLEPPTHNSIPASQAHGVKNFIHTPYTKHTHTKKSAWTGMYKNSVSASNTPLALCIMLFTNSCKNVECTEKNNGPKWNECKQCTRKTTMKSPIGVLHIVVKYKRCLPSTLSMEGI